MSEAAFSHITPTIGTEITGLDLTQADAATMARMRALLNERMVLVFRDQQLSQAQHKALGAHFGTGVLHRHPLAIQGGNTDPEVLPVKADANSKYVAGEDWHTDVSCDPAPIAVSMLYMRKTPENGGGDTLFSSMYDALDTLSPPIRALVETLSARHNGARPWRDVYGIEPPKDQPYNISVHPCVLTHPETGRPLLWVNGGFTDRILGLSQHEGGAILRMLLSHIERGVKFQCRVKWRPGTLVMWDNIATQHTAAWDYFPQSRHAERVSVIGADLTAQAKAA